MKSSADLEERLKLAVYFKSQLGRLVELVYTTCGKIVDSIGETEARRLIRELVLSAVKAVTSADINYFLGSLMRATTRSIRLELRVEDVFRLGEDVLITMVELAKGNDAPSFAGKMLEEYVARYKSDEVRVKLFQEYLHLMESQLFRQVQELSLLASISQLKAEDFLVNTTLPELLLTRLMDILEADDGVAYFQSEFFRVIFTRFKGEEPTSRRAERVERLLSTSVNSSFDPRIYSEFKSLVEEGYSWDVSRRDREIIQLLEAFYPQFHQNPTKGSSHRLLDFELQNPLLQFCTVHSYMTYDLHVDERNYGLIFVNKADPPEFSEADYRFLSTFGGHLRQIIGNIILTQKLQEMAITDSLTGVYNRRQFETFLENEMLRAKRYNYSVGLAMIDLDHFKEINDTLGHQAGDHILAELCRVLKQALRVTEIIARYGGEEFAVVIPQADMDVVRMVGEKIRSAVEQHKFYYRGKLIPLTVSVGLALFPQMGIDKESIIAAADAALYRAKQEGRNRVRFRHPIEKEVSG